jgi:4-hydroxythreonine-4-phosphate dehydrogenase
MPLAVTPGEPAGIGAEITLKAWKSGQTGLFFLLDDPNRVAERAKLAGLNIPNRLLTALRRQKNASLMRYLSYPTTSLLNVPLENPRLITLLQ